ncbi:exodeoxyribonuclease-3 [Naumannella halotolerans]|uniref:Exodeoxyribonuclease-3 n=1 Tax=Naumannella halotolerans TaxID=993414 RepID=A0A4R7JA47_9ACTN|nr:exodeoxyribonuclease-3 [Naumannella halotolerans]
MVGRSARLASLAVLRIGTLNVNGIRAADRRGLRQWLAEHDPDVLTLQEVRAEPDLIPEGVFDGYHLSCDAGSLKGRNGVAVLSKAKPLDVRTSMGAKEFAAEGRWIEVDLPELTVASLYLPKGASPDDAERIEAYHRKMRYLPALARHLTKARRAAAKAGREFLVTGDFNIAHTENDLKNPKTNRRSPGFLAEEREWFSQILGPRTLTDVVRALHPDQAGPYSWWSWRGQAWTNDAGWRIDYQLASRALADAAVTGGTYRDPSYEARISDHAPVVVDYRV